MSKEKKSASGAKKEKLKKVNEAEDALPQEAEAKLAILENTTTSISGKAEVAVEQAEKLGGKDAFKKLKELITEMEVAKKTKEVFQKSLEDFTNLRKSIANNAQDKDLLIKEIDGIINKLNIKIEALAKADPVEKLAENPADSVSTEVIPDAPEPEKEPKPKKTRTRTKKEAPTENTASAEALKVSDTVELDPTITTPTVVAVAPDAPGTPEPTKTEAGIITDINKEIEQAEAQRLSEGKEALTNYDKWQIAIKLMPPSDKELERRNNPGTRQKIENWWLGKNTSRASKLTLAATKAVIIGGAAFFTTDVSTLGKGAWRVASSVATSYLGDTKAVKDLIGVVAGKYENLNKKQKLIAKGAVALAAGLAVGGGVALGAVTATGAGIGLAGAGARFGIKKLMNFIKRTTLERVKDFDINSIYQNFDEVSKKFRQTERVLQYGESIINLQVSLAVAEISAQHYTDEHYKKQIHEIEEEIKKMETYKPTVDDINSEMSQLKNQISHMGADEKETSDLLKEKFNALSNDKHSLAQQQESPANRNGSNTEIVTVADRPIDNSGGNENLFSIKNLAEAWGDRPQPENPSSKPTSLGQNMNKENFFSIKNLAEAWETPETEEVVTPIVSEVKADNSDNLFSIKNLAEAWKVNDPQHEVEKIIPGDRPTIEKKIPITGSTEAGEENDIQKPSPEKTEIKGTAKESLPSETPKVKEIHGMDAKFVVPKGLGITHVVEAQVEADRLAGGSMGDDLAKQIKFEGKMYDADGSYSKEYYKAVGEYLGKIKSEKDGDYSDVRVKLEGDKDSKYSKAAYELVKGDKGLYLKESHLVNGKWIEVEDNEQDKTFEGDTKDNIENKDFDNKHDYEYLHERKTVGPAEHKTDDPKATIPAGPSKEEIIPTTEKKEVFLEEEIPPKPAPSPRERVKIVRQVPQGNGLAKAGYMVGGDYMANADYEARGDNTSPYPDFRGGMPPGMEMYNFTPQEIRDIQMEAGSLSEARSKVLQKMMMGVARNPNMGPNLPVILYQDIALKGEAEMNADLNKIINGSGSYLESKDWDEMQSKGVVKFVKDNINTPGDKGQLAKYIRNLENVSGLEPKNGIARHEKVGEFIRRAHADLAIKEMKGKFDYRNLSVPGEIKAPVIDVDESAERTETPLPVEKIDFNKTDMYDLWEKNKENPDSLNSKETEFMAKINKLRNELGSARPSIGNGESAQHYLERLEKIKNNQ